MDTIKVVIGENSKYEVCALVTICGKDINAAICGGTSHHVGAVSLACYEPVRDSATVSTICAFSHRDDQVSSFVSKELSKTFKCTACVSCGIHVDDADENELKELMTNVKALVSSLISKINL